MPEDDPLRRLLHRWFVEYNPLYLLSAALVLGGLTAVSHAVAQDGSVAGQLGVAAVAELYAFALVGGAAVLVRLGQRRVAVMLGLLVVLYQGDPTLHLETCAYLGAVGRVASVAWVALFVVKLHALAWALELRLALSARVVPIVGAAVLAVLPHALRDLAPVDRGALVALSVFALGASALFAHREVQSAVGFDVRGARCLRAAWLLLGALGLGHVLYWGGAEGVPLAPLALVVPLLGTRFARRERTVWLSALGAVAAAAILLPEALSVTALLAAATLTLRALRAPVALAGSPRATPPPYRDRVDPPPPPRLAFGRPPGALRLLVGALGAAYVAAWAHGWEGGAWPTHALGPDLLLALGTVGFLAFTRRPWVLAPLALSSAHLAVELGWVGAPRGALEWGVGAVLAGFALLGGGLLASWRLGPRPLDAPSLGALSGPSTGPRARHP